MIKKFGLLLILFILSVSLLPVYKVTADSLQAIPDPTLPDHSGIYNVPGNPRLKLRVFVHEPGRPDFSRPGATSSSTLTQTCGLTDPNSASVDGTTGWYIPDGSWTYHVNPSGVPAPVTNLSDVVSNSFSAWSTAGVGKHVTFVRGSDITVSRSSLDGLNIIAWGHAPGSVLAVTYTWYYPDTHHVAEVDTIFNKKFAWAWNGGGTSCAYTNYYDAQDILTHELGHWMGLDDEYTAGYVNNTMYGYGSPTEVKKDTLTVGDTSALFSLYP